MYTLIEIFDSKQYENIISPVLADGISGLVYIGTKDTMTSEKIRNVKNFFAARDFRIPIDFFYVERDNSSSVINTLEEILKSNPSCVLDVTGGEDAILLSAGIIAQKYSVPVIRTNAQSGDFSIIFGSPDKLSFNSNTIGISDFITLQGGKIRFSETIEGFSKEETKDIKMLFRVNATDCEAYSIFCNFVSEYVFPETKTVFFKKSELAKKTNSYRNAVTSTLKLLCDSSLLKEEDSAPMYFTYSIKSDTVARCLKKAGNILEYYTALAASNLNDIFYDIRVGTAIEWNDTNMKNETLNEIDVLAVSRNTPVFISCKNGEVKKEALYELDTVSRALGGAYTKRILVCTHISANRSARAHFIKRARDMNIHLIYDANKKTYSEFMNYLKNSVT